jgi:hypothetical protein
MFLGSILGGVTGSHWHTKLERKVFEEERGEGVAAAPVHDHDHDHDHDHVSDAPTTTSRTTGEPTTTAERPVVGNPPTDSGTTGTYRS